MISKIKYIAIAAALLPLVNVNAQSSDPNPKFAIKPTVNIGFGNALSTDFTLPDIDAKSTSTDFGVDFGWTFWTKNAHSLEANIGLGYASTAIKANISKMDYSYSAPATADMDRNTYIRFYQLEGLHQKISTNFLTLPIYLNYHYRVNRSISINALLGLKLGFNVSSSVSETKGTTFCYGIYPQYDNLMIDAPYMNAFGSSDLSNDQTLSPSKNSLNVAIMAGLGVEYHFWGPLSLAASIRYESSMTNLFKSSPLNVETITADNAPVTYTVADGQKVKPLTDYLTKSKISRPSCALSLIYRF